MARLRAVCGARWKGGSSIARLWAVCGAGWKVGGSMARLWDVCVERVERLEVAWLDCGLCVERVGTLGVA